VFSVVDFLYADNKKRRRTMDKNEAYKEAEKAYFTEKVMAILRQRPRVGNTAVRAFLGPGPVSKTRLEAAFKEGRAPAPWQARLGNWPDAVLTQAAFPDCAIELYFSTSLSVEVKIGSVDIIGRSDVLIADYGNFFDLLSRFGEVYNERAAAFVAWQKERDNEEAKEEKIRNMTRDAVRLWLSRIGEELGLPYHINANWEDATLTLQLANKSELSVRVQCAGFQQTLPLLAAKLRPYIDMVTADMTPVEIEMPSEREDWTVPKIQRGEEQ
jgi:hypothetical protein